MSLREHTREQNVIAGKRDYVVNGRDHAVNGLALGRESLLISILFYGEERLCLGWQQAGLPHSAISDRRFLIDKLSRPVLEEFDESCMA
jgi:hypothetical protein